MLNRQGREFEFRGTTLIHPPFKKKRTFFPPLRRVTTETNCGTASSLQLQGEFSVFLYQFAPNTGSLKQTERLLLLFNAFELIVVST
jgi:hypothetical protein